MNMKQGEEEAGITGRFQGGWRTPLSFAKKPESRELSDRESQKLRAHIRVTTLFVTKPKPFVD